MRLAHFRASHASSCGCKWFGGSCAGGSPKPVDWDGLYCHLSASFGWTLEQASQITLAELQGIRQYQDKHPPVHALVAGFVGFEPPKDESDSSDGFDELLAQSGNQQSGFVPLVPFRAENV